MFDWLKRKPKRPSDFELTSRIASTIDGFIDLEGFSEFESDRLSIVIENDFRESIVAGAYAKRFSPNAILVVPFNQLGLDTWAVQKGGPLRHRAVDTAARVVVNRLTELGHPASN